MFIFISFMLLFYLIFFIFVFLPAYYALFFRSFYRFVVLFCFAGNNKIEGNNNGKLNVQN